MPDPHQQVQEGNGGYRGPGKSRPGQRGKTLRDVNQADGSAHRNRQRREQEITRRGRRQEIEAKWQTYP